jgi:catechol 2,3-dioxygenase-like lactoylglutathione lyase family enzyme
MPLVNQILETALYVNDLEEAERFYSQLFDIKVYAKDAKRHVFFRIGNSMLLLFNPLETQKEGLFPVHGAHGAGHVAFAVEHRDLDFWRQRLRDLGINIEKEHEWPDGGQSIYFRDPSGNSLELATTDTWPENA